MQSVTEHASTIGSALNIGSRQVAGVISLLGDGCTIPFIARYRKEATGSLDEVQIGRIRDELQIRQEFLKRRAAILSSLEKQGVLTDTLQASINGVTTLAALEDIYLPHRAKRRTRAAMAREAGLVPLAESLYSKKVRSPEMQSFLAELDSPLSVDEAMAGSRDIIAERISEDPPTRDALRRLFRKRGSIYSTVVAKKQDRAEKYRDYFKSEEQVTRIAGHRLLAMLRGENEKYLTISLRPPEDEALAVISRMHIGPGTGNHPQVRMAIADGYDRLLAPSLENELKKELKADADQEAIEVFADNLRELLLTPPLGEKRVLAIDPGFRTGAKLCCLDGQGALLHHTTVYPTHSDKQKQQAGRTIIDLIDKYAIEAIAIGDGTAGRETESFIRSLSLVGDMLIIMVNEAGASVYSASETARREFPDLDLTFRGAISIGRRLQDPLAELVKIDPKAIGVGQYQHDVNQAALKQSLDDVVEHCVTSVGVQVNSASVELLTAVSGLGSVLAGNIIEYRHQNGPYQSRRELLKIPRLGPKAYEQCAGFLRIDGAANPLDGSGVHPERYAVVRKMARDLKTTVNELMQSPDLQAKLDPANYTDTDLGLPTLLDILAELSRPGRDPRKEFTVFSFAEDVHTMEDLQVGMELPAIITNVTKFGAFADIGVHQDGLIHISQLADRFIKEPSEIVVPRQQVKVRVLDIDITRRRIALSMKNLK